MDAINARIAALIRESGKTKTEWANQLKVTPQFISSLCNGKTRPSDRTVSDICRLSGVREEWLREGAEPMYAAQMPEPLDALLQNRQIPTADLAVIKSVVRAFLELDDQPRKEVVKFLQSCAAKLNAPADASAPDGDLAAKVEALQRQNRDLLARLEAIEKEEAETPEPVPESVTPSRSR